MIVSFQPTTFKNPTFQVTLDGGLYIVTMTWNIYRAGTQNSGWYFNVYDQTNTLIVSKPLVSSLPPPATGVNLVAGFFKTSTVYFYAATSNFVILP